MLSAEMTRHVCVMYRGLFTCLFSYLVGNESTGLAELHWSTAGTDAESYCSARSGGGGGDIKLKALSLFSAGVVQVS